ncbi:hypothetical protein GDO81_018478 [Engystomops pustulosus]|uniref:BESS domain-containing protein n=1 Tax=Engystomops pustulosus TaxID=76066 RepID=A0AAV6ZU54_ENGPU|nr:hypothetical protein GDO81_018462 [Engystomops pustulosus]KAG8551115.1 hypothetical protein GDO81_018478 [Engystomops pustulosus]
MEDLVLLEVLEQLRKRRGDTPEVAFMRSLVPELKKVPPEERANCKAAIFAILQIFQKKDYPHKNEIALILNKQLELLPQPGTYHPG